MVILSASVYIIILSRSRLQVYSMYIAFASGGPTQAQQECRITPILFPLLRERVHFTVPPNILLESRAIFRLLLFAYFFVIPACIIDSFSSCLRNVYFSWRKLYFLWKSSLNWHAQWTGCGENSSIVSRPILSYSHQPEVWPREEICLWLCMNVTAYGISTKN